MRTVKLYEAKAKLAELVAAAEAGETIVIAKGDRPVAMLTPLDETLVPPPPGTYRPGQARRRG